MRRLLLGAILLLLSGCQSPAASTVVEPAGSSGAAVAPAPPPPTEEQAVAMAAKLVTYESDLYGVSFSYPENLSAPAISEMGLHPLKLDLGNGEISIYRREAEAGKSLADLVAENIDANTKASHGRIVSKNLGRQTLGGNEAWAVQRHFDSAAGRYDAIQYIVLKGGFEYSVTCRTKQGPPVIPWQLVEPACQRILATISFMER